jgi:chromate transporter
VTWELARAAVVGIWTTALLLVALVVVFRFKINSAWLVLGGGLTGLLLRFGGLV